MKSEPKTLPKTSKRNWRTKVFKRFRRDEDGATAIEFALLMPLFIWLLFGTLELFVNATYNSMLSNALLEVERQIKTGQVTASTSAEDFRKDILCKATGIGSGISLFDCDKMHVDVKQVGQFDTPEKFRKDEDGSFDSSGFDFAPGGASTINIVRIFYEMPSITGMTNMVDAENNKHFVDGKRVLGASAAFWIEPR